MRSSTGVRTKGKKIMMENNVLYELADGEYTGEIIDVSIEKTEKGSIKVTWLVRIIRGEHTGCCVEKKYHLTTDKVIEFMKREFKLIEFEVNSGADIEGKRQEIIGTKFVFSAVNNDAGWLVFYVKGLIKDTAAAAKPVAQFPEF